MACTCLSAPQAGLAGGRGFLLLSPTTNNSAHRGIDTQSIRVVHIFVAGQPAVDRLPQRAQQAVLCVLSATGIEEQSASLHASWFMLRLNAAVE